jgi:undecaprenyl diphosphate synthase
MDRENLKLPEHIAIILDGNGRWAKAKGMPRSYGHVVGCDNLEKMCTYINDIGVKYLTVYAFSTENWKRSMDEVGVLMNLFRRYLKRLIKKSVKDQIRIRVIGSREGLAHDILKIIEELEGISKDFKGMSFQIALNYGSRDEILRGIRRLSGDVLNGAVDPADIDESVFKGYLDTFDIPDPDLLIRTSGEQRISNFLLWQLAYTELYFTDTAWPDFKEPQLWEAIETFNHRDRRFGNIK